MKVRTQIIKDSKLRFLSGVFFLLIFVNPQGFAEGGPEDPLTIAVSKNQIEKVRSLLANGVDVDGTGVVPLTPLMIAAAQGNAAMVRLLLAAGADPGRTTSHGESALFFAAFGGHYEIVRELLARPSVRDLVNKKHLIFGSTPLSVAVPTGRTEVVRMLLDAGADPSISIRLGETVFDHCRHNDDNEACSLIRAIKTDGE